MCWINVGTLCHESQFTMYIDPAGRSGVLTGAGQLVGCSLGFILGSEGVHGTVLELDSPDAVGGRHLDQLPGETWTHAHQTVRRAGEVADIMMEPSQAD